VTVLTVHAPFSGWLLDLSEVPDEAFAGGMVGQGVAIDPTDWQVRAPFDGIVAGLPDTKHAVTLRSAEGVEVLIHIGLETVAMAGEGFTAHVAPGDAVRTGDLLLDLDLDRIAEEARSLVSPIVAISGAGRAEPLSTRRRVEAGEPILRIAVQPAAGEATSDAASPEREVKPHLPLGLHARPAARIAACVRTFDARVTLVHGERRADAASLVAMMGLGVKDGDILRLTAAGPQAAEALTALETLMKDGLEDAPTASPPAAAVPASIAPVRAGDGELILGGVAASPGLVIGRAVRLTPPALDVPRDGEGVAREREALDRALKALRTRLAKEAGSGDVHRRAILAAHLGFLDDPALIADAGRAIGEGRSAGHAWREATSRAADVFRAIGDPRMAERADDLLDLERQVIAGILGVEPPAPRIAAGAIVVADDLLPSQLLALDPACLAGLCTARGGPTSHVAILAAAMGVPALVAVGDGLDQIGDGALVVLDADRRRVIADPSAARQAEAQAAMTASARHRAEARARAGEPCHTADGTRIEVFANLGTVAEAAPAVAGGAEGCGLLRTEFLFLDRQTAPDEDEQLACYQAIADALDGRPLIIRTLDAGGDKPLPYLVLPPDENPALGLRGVRSGLHRPDLLMTQLRAICRVRSSGTVAVMAPMIASVAEVRQVRAMLDTAAVEVDASPPFLGVMIETPAAAVTADRLAPEIDFVSVGTNDLTQYALAMDRQNPALAAQLDGLHPAVLRLIEQAAAGAASTRWIGVCGGLASEPAAATILIGLGVRELSVAPAMVAEIKAVVRTLTLDGCRRLAALALEQDGPEAVRALAAEHLAAAFEPRVGAVA
jgi:multiphosphoryl transfer protein